jgi:hypothetical protein
MLGIGFLLSPGGWSFARRSRGRIAGPRYWGFMDPTFVSASCRFRHQHKSNPSLWSSSRGFTLSSAVWSCLIIFGADKWMWPEFSKTRSNIGLFGVKRFHILRTKTITRYSSWTPWAPAHVHSLAAIGSSKFSMDPNLGQGNPSPSTTPSLWMCGDPIHWVGSWLDLKLSV